MTTMHRATAFLTAVGVAAGCIALSAHEVLYRGTVVAFNLAKYATPDGGTREVRELEVTIIDPKTKKSSTRVFTIPDDTQIFRDGKELNPAEMSAQKDEAVAVVLDHDIPGDEALEIRFGTDAEKSTP